MSDKTANICVTVFIIVMSVIAVGIMRELYMGIAERSCTSWQEKPLDQVDRKCIKRFIEETR